MSAMRAGAEPMPRTPKLDKGAPSPGRKRHARRVEPQERHNEVVQDHRQNHDRETQGHERHEHGRHP